MVKDTNHSPTRPPAKPVTENNVPGAKAGAGQTDASLSNTIDLKDIANTSITSGRAGPEALGQSLSKGDLTNPLHRLASVTVEALADKNLGETTLQGTRTAEILRHLVDRLESISKDLGAIQLSNLATSPTPAFEECYLFPIPLATAGGATTAHLKVFRRPGQQAVDPDNVRLALLLDLPELGEIAINFNVFEKRLSGQILSERERTHQRVKSGLNELHHRLNDLGYWIDSLTCNMFSDQEESPLATNNEIKASGSMLSRVNVRA
jgi:hypothetical protein